jgi:hypothetical protein
MTSNQNCSNSSANRIKATLNGRKSITFRELRKKADVSTEELEDFLLPLLGEEGVIEGKLEVRCPNCGADLGSYSKYTDIPKKNDCEICGHSIPFSDNYLEIVLEVKGDFFRGNDEPQPFTKRNYTNEELESLLANAIKEKKEVPKGKMFEEFFRNLVERENEFELKKLHARSDVGEMDYFYKANCRDHPLWDKYPYFFVECKNRKEVVSSESMDHFKELLEAKTVFHNCFGIYITTKRFSPQANISAQKGIAKGLVIIRIDRSDMTDLIEKGFRIYIEEAFDEFLSKA